jgi:hypothetical protein
VALTLLLCVLLRPVQPICLLAVFFRLLHRFCPSRAVLFRDVADLGGEGYLTTFSPDQQNALALLSINPITRPSTSSLSLASLPSS